MYMDFVRIKKSKGRVYMRTINRTFSIEQTASDYLDTRKLEDPKFSASQFLSEWLTSMAVKEKTISPIKLIKCETCEAEYSNNLKTCPSCQTHKLKESEQLEKDSLEALKQTRAIAEKAEQEALTASKKVKWLKLKELLESKPDIFNALNEFKNNTPDSDDYRDFVNDYRNAEVKLDGLSITNYDILNYFRGKEKYEIVR